MTALLCLLTLLAQNPPDPVRAAVAALDGNKPAEAVALLAPVAEKEPQNLAAWFHLGLAYAMLNQDDKSIDAYRKTLALDANLYEAKLNLAQVLLRQKRGAEAKEQIEAALQQKPGEKKLILWQAEALLLLGQHEDAASVFEKAGEAGEAAAVREAEALALLKAGKPEDAAVLLEKVIAAAPTTAARYALAIAYLRSKQTDKSRAVAEELVKAEPGNVEFRMFYGRLLRDQRKFPDAARQFNEAVKLKPEAVEGWNELTGMLIMLEMYEPALQGLEKIRSLQGETPYYWWFRATVLDATRQPKPALEAYQHFLSLSQGKSPDEEFKARQRVRILQKVVSK